jgi:formylmethanofuran dehydrogenase subunit C
MSGLTLTLRAPLPDRLDLGAAFEEPWSGATADEIARRPVMLGGTAGIPLGDVFSVTGTAGDRATIEGDLSLVDRVGASLAEGTLEVRGNVGNRAGAGLRGGRLLIEGQAGNHTGEGMSAGVIVVRGSAGHRTGGAAPGRKRGMTGGELVVHGSAGDETGAGMRRGLVAVGGRTGACTMLSCIAGTVVSFGATGADPAAWNKRGSLICLSDVSPGPTYRYACAIQPVYLRLLLRRLRDVYGLAVTDAHLNGQYRRFSGDFSETGRGEIFAWSPA